LICPPKKQQQRLHIGPSMTNRTQNMEITSTFWTFLFG